MNVESIVASKPRLDTYERSHVAKQSAIDILFGFMIIRMGVAKLEAQLLGVVLMMQVFALKLVNAMLV
jgi:hypothetical protein